MQSRKSGTLEYYFISSNKKPRNNEQEMEPNTAISSSLSSPEIQDSLVLPRYPAIKVQLTIPNDLTSFFILSSFLNENSHRKSIPNDISMSL